MKKDIDIKSILNNSQWEACKYMGNSLILAGAGAGKTHTMVYKIAHIGQTVDYEPREMMIITFTNKAARELKERVNKILGDNISYPYLWTFHSVFSKILREHPEFLASQWYTSDCMIIIPQNEYVEHAIESSKEKFPVQWFGSANNTRDIISEMSQLREAVLLNKDISNFEEKIKYIHEEYTRLKKENDVIDFDDIMELTHIGLSKQQIDTSYFKYIFVDEAQDTNTVQWEIIQMMKSPEANLYLVWDDFQCLTWDTKIDVENGKKEIKDIKVWDKVLSYDNGKNVMWYYPVTRVYEQQSHNWTYTITTTSGKKITATWDHVFFAHPEKIAESSDKEYCVYLMYRRNVGYRIGMTKFKEGNNKNNVSGLRMRLNSESADKAWILFTSNDIKEVMLKEQFYSFQYGIPQIMFNARESSKLSFSQDNINDLFDSIDTHERGEKLLSELGFSEQFPHVIASATNRHNASRVNINYLMIANNTNTVKGWYHRLVINTSHEVSMKLLQDNFGDVCRLWQKNGKVFVRVDKISQDAKYIRELIFAIEKMLLDADVNVVLKQNIRFNNESFMFMPASQLQPGFAITTYNNGTPTVDYIASIEKTEENVTVYDIDVDTTHNFVANDIIVHNCLYSRRGSDVDTFLNVQELWPDMKLFRLPENYRSYEHIVTMGNELIKNNKKQFKKDNISQKGKHEGWKNVKFLQHCNDYNQAYTIAEKIQEYVDAWEYTYKDFAVLYRNNWQSDDICHIFTKKEIPYKILKWQSIEDNILIQWLIGLDTFIKSRTQHSFKQSLQLFMWWEWGEVADMFFNKYLDSQNVTFEEYFFEKEYKNYHCTMLPWEPGEALKKLKDIIHYYTSQTEKEKTYKFYEIFSHLHSLLHSDLKSETTKTELSNIREFMKKHEIEVMSDILITDFETSNKDDDENEDKWVVFSTIHGSKGLEFKVVFIIGLEEWLISPAKWNEEEERRILYVGITRARDDLYLNAVEQRTVFGRTKQTKLSSFMNEIKHLVEIPKE